MKAGVKDATAVRRRYCRRGERQDPHEVNKPALTSEKRSGNIVLDRID